MLRGIKICHDLDGGSARESERETDKEYCGKFSSIPKLVVFQLKISTIE